MEYNKPINQMLPGNSVMGFYMLRSATLRVTNSGKPYLSAVLSDSTGSIDSKYWDYSGLIDSSCEGKIVKILGEVQEFKGSNQLNIQKIRLTKEDDEYNLNDIVPTAPIDAMQELEYIRSLISSIEDSDYSKICEFMLDRHIITFSRMPAGKTVHHSFLSGLLMHTGSMLRIADFLSINIYPDAVDRSLLLAGTLLHDFAKEREYKLSELGLITDLTVPGVLLGHLVMGAEEVGTVGNDLDIPSEKILLLKHMILSHHGEPEHGAAVVPCIAEAELLSYIDLIDSRMEIYAETLENMEKGTFSDKIWSLDKKIYNHN